MVALLAPNVLFPRTLHKLTEPLVMGQDDVILDHSIFRHELKLYRSFDISQGPPM